MNNDNFMGFRCTFHVRPEAKIHREHNIRDPKLVKYETHIDSSRYSETTLDLGTLDDAYKTIFGDSLAAYNKGKRKDRQIDNYLEEIIHNDKRRGKHKNQKADGSRKAAYEAYITIGNRDNQPDHEKSLKVLKLFVEKWIPEHYPNIKPICISYHDDEFSLDDKTGERIYSAPHCHFDYIYVADCLTAEEQKAEKKYRAEQKALAIKECERKGIPFNDNDWKKKDWQLDLVKRTGKSLVTGLSLQSSMSGALAQMGFKTGIGRQTAQIQFEESVRHDLENFAESMGLKIDRTPGVKHSHVEKNVYQQKKDNERKELELIERESSIIKDEKVVNERFEEVRNKESELAENAEYNRIQKELNDNVANENQKFKETLEKSVSAVINKEKKLKAEKEEIQKQAFENNEVAKLNSQKSRELKEEELRIGYDRSKLEHEQILHKHEVDNLASKEEEVNNKKWNLYEEGQKLKEINEKLTKREAELCSREQSVSRKEDFIKSEKKLLEDKKKEFNKNYEQVNFYQSVTTYIDVQHITVDKAVKEFEEHKDIFSFRERFSSFISTIKDCITSISLKLQKYKKAFQKFWNWTPNHFRTLANEMEQNDCNTYEQYFSKTLIGTVREYGQDTISANHGNRNRKTQSKIDDIGFDI